MELLLSAVELRRHVVNTKNLPTITVVLSKVLDLVEDINSSVADLENVILNDQSIAAKILGLSNSAFYAFGREINTISQAIIVIGFNAVKSLAVGVTIFEKFYNQVQKSDFDIDGLWMHSVATAECARIINQRLNLVSSEAAFICGLLHDVGKVALIAIIPDEYGMAAREAREEERGLLEIEQEAFEITHATLGTWVAERWHLPPDLVSCIGEHHNATYDGDHAELVHTVALADYIARKLEIGVSPDPVVQPVSNFTLEVLGLSQDQITEFEESLLKQQEKIEHFFEILK